MNLCLACREVSLDCHGGLPRAVCDLAEALARKGHTVHLLTDATDAPLPDLPGVSIKRLLVPPASGPCAGAIPESAAHNLMHAAAVYREVRRAHERERPVDAVVAPMWRSEGALCLLDARFPTIVSCMTSLQTLTEVDSSYGLLPDIAERLSLEREALARSGYLHGLTRAVLAKTIADYKLRPDATAVIGRGLRDRDGHEPDYEYQAASEHPHRDGTPHVLFVGRIERRKGVDTLLAAACQLLDEGLPFSFTLAGPNGDTGLRDALEREVAEQPSLRAAVRFAGAVSDAELNRLYLDSDIVCVPSRYESHGIVLIEAMMFGKPIATCDAGGIAEVVRGGHNALISPPDEPRALAVSLRQLADSGLRARLGAAGRKSYEQHFQVQDIAGQMESFVEEVISFHRQAHDGPDVREGLEALLGDALTIAPDHASALAGELLDPPPEAWHALWPQRELEQLQAETARLKQAVASQEKSLAFLHMRHETLCRVEQGGWWRLRGRVLPVLRLIAWLRGLIRGG